MKKISRQLRRYFIFIAILSILFITIVSNISISLFFSDYLKESRNRDDLRIVQYIEQVYLEYNGLNSHSLMGIMHYAISEDVIIRIKDGQSNLIWDSATLGAMHGMAEKDAKRNITYKNYPFTYQGAKIGSIGIGRTKSILSTFEDKQFLLAINGVFLIAFLFSILIAILSSTKISKKFLNPIYGMKENAKLIESGEYKSLREVKTNTYELHDLSESVKELAQRLDSQEMLRRRMTSDIAHELRTPLAIIQSHIEAFIDGVWEPDIEKLSIIQNEIIRLTKLIKELSDLSIIENEEIKIDKNEINLSVLLNRILENFEPVFMGKSISLNKQTEENISFMGDGELLNRVFTNILSNAYKYTNENGKVFVTLEQLKNKIRVTIEDTGIGIPKEDLKHIFERFYRSDLSRNRGTGGTGIGLTLTKALIEAHGGRIRIESEEGKGTKVMIEFPK